jgi:hypothetical protein
MMFILIFSLFIERIAVNCFYGIINIFHILRFLKIIRRLLFYIQDLSSKLDFNFCQFFRILVQSIVFKLKLNDETGIKNKSTSSWSSSSVGKALVSHRGC